MRVSLRGRLFLSHLLVVALALAGAVLLVGFGAREWVIDTRAGDLLRSAHLAAASLERAPAAWGEGSAAAVALGRELGARVTLIARDGRVLGDSDVSDDRLGTLENHGRRPEVLAALAQGEGRAVRTSATLERVLLYAAVRADSGPVAVVRLAQPVTVVSALAGALAARALPAALFALLAAAVLVMVITGRHAARIAALHDVALRLAADERGARALESPPDDLGRLGRAINQMAAEGRDRLDRLSEVRDEHARILAEMSDGVALLDGNGRIARCNHSLATLLDEPRPAAPGTPFTDYVRIAELHELVQRARAERRAVEADLRLWTPGPRLLHAQAAPLGEEPEGPVLLVLRDLTEMERLSRIRQDFVANVSHELRTPLTTIRGYAETLLEGGLEDEPHRRGFVESIRGGAARLEQMVGELLALSELERAGGGLRLGAVDLRQIAETQVAAHRGIAERAGLALALEPGSPAPLQGDRARLEQVLANLLDNAIKYTEQGRIDVRVGMGDGRAWAEVADTGPGIPIEDQPRVFERFYRVDKARSREKGGTGLGLSIVKHIVALHGGEISVRSVVGRGSTFLFEVPTHVRAESASPPGPAPESISGISRSEMRS